MDNTGRCQAITENRLMVPLRGKITKCSKCYKTSANSTNCTALYQVQKALSLSCLAWHMAKLPPYSLYTDYSVLCISLDNDALLK